MLLILNVVTFFFRIDYSYSVQIFDTAGFSQASFSASPGGILQGVSGGGSGSGQPVYSYSISYDGVGNVVSYSDINTNLTDDSSPKGSETSYSAHVHRSGVGQYGPKCPGIAGIDGICGNVYSVAYGWSMRSQRSIPTRPLTA
jgi:hypothetical protein